MQFDLSYNITVKFLTNEVSRKTKIIRIIEEFVK